MASEPPDRASGTAPSGGAPTNLFAADSLAPGGGFGLSSASGPGGGGGGGHGVAGTIGGGGVNGGGGGSPQGSADFLRPLALFVPDRFFQPNAAVSGGAGGGGGGFEDDTNTNEAGDVPNPLVSVAVGTRRVVSGDDAGAGGGSGGGAIWILAASIDVQDEGKILMRGGAGGNTYADDSANPVPNLLVIDPDTMVAGDEYVSGIADPTLTGTGSGGGGGGGAGGAILLQGRDFVSVDANARLDVSGGAGGTAAGAAGGGAGARGRIGIVAFQGTTDFATSGVAPAPPVGTILPDATALTLNGAIWEPTVDETSQGVSKWYDLLGTNTVFQIPFWTDNVAILTGPPNNLVQGTDFDLVIELQGATGLSPALPADPTTTTALTPWTVHTSFATMNGMQFIRWRARFRVRRTGALDPAVHPMPTLFDITVPFQKT